MLAGNDYSGIIISLLFLSMMTRGRSKSLESPCPNIFNYRYDQKRNLYGEVQIKGIRAQTVQLNVELSLGNPTEGQNGKIELSKPIKQVVQDILEFKPTTYKVKFPNWRMNPPKITKISVNGNLVCSGPPFQRNLVQGISTARLSHTMTSNRISFDDSPSPPTHSTSSPPPSTKKPPPLTNNPFLPADPSEIYNGNPFLRKTSEKPYRLGETSKVQVKTTTKLNHQDSQPSHSPKNNQHNLNPVMPADPSAVYHGNPFFEKPSKEPHIPGGTSKEKMKVRYDLTPPPPIYTPPRPTLHGNPFFEKPSEKPHIPEGTSKEKMKVLYDLTPPPPIYTPPRPTLHGNPFFEKPSEEPHIPEGTSKEKKKVRYDLTPPPPIYTPPRPTLHGNPFFEKPSEKPHIPEGTSKEKKKVRYDLTPPPPIYTPPRPTLPQVSHRKEDITSTHRSTIFLPESSTPKVDGGFECGLPILMNSLISNGEAVPRGAYPWLGALYRIKPSGFLYICSGSLISNRHVVTAAHCVKNQDNRVLKPQELVIILGKHNLQRWGRYRDGEIMIEPESISVHPDHKESSADADIAVLVLIELVEFSKFVLPLCLWREDTELQEIVGMEGVVVGWGSDLNGVLMTDEPKQTKLPIVSQESCLRSSYEFLHVTSNRTFCAGFRNGNGPCNGDSGSGFIMKRNGRWTLRGVVSTSLRDPTTRSCDLSNYVVFTDASKYLDWLISFIK